MAYLEHGPRVGRSQGTNFFWGLVSVCFAAAACYYFWKNTENEVAANRFRNEVATLQEDQENLKAQKEKLQTSFTEREAQIKTHEDLLTEKESRLADEQSRLEALSQQVQGPGATTQGQIATIKKFADALRKIAQEQGGEVVIRGGRPVLRLSTGAFFAPPDSTLSPGGGALLTQIASSLKGASETFELRIEAFTDPTSEGSPAATTTKLRAWELTAQRAAVIAYYFRDNPTLPWQNVLVVPRGDTGSRKPRLEITLAPVPPIFKASAMAAPAAPPAPIESPVPAKL